MSYQKDKIGIGEIQRITIPNPGSVNPVTITVPSNQIWWLQSVFFNFISSPVLGDREVFVRMLDSGGGSIVDIGSGYVQADNETHGYGYVRGGAFATTIANPAFKGFINNGLGSQYLLPSESVEIDASNFQLVDEFQDIQIAVNVYNIDA